MIRSRAFFATVIIVCFSKGILHEAQAQQRFIGSQPAESPVSPGYAVDSNGRAFNTNGFTADQFGQNVDGYGWSSWNNRLPSHSASRYGTDVSGGYSGGYYSPYGSYGSSYGSTYISPPRTVIVGGVGPTRTVINNATRGTVIEYTHNGNGYISTPGSSYQTVISNGPSIFPYTTVVQPTDSPVIIESRRTPAVAKTFSGNTGSRDSHVASSIRQSEIQLICPKDSSIPLTYLLNGTTYTIKPGYSQTFADDRRWTIEFLRGGNGGQLARYELKAGTYRFEADKNGWDLRLYPAPAVAEIPPSPAPPELSTPVPAPKPAPDL